MRLTFIGVGQVGGPLAARLADLGHSVTIAARDPSSETVRNALARSPRLGVLPVAEAVAQSEAVFLATPFQVVETTVVGLAGELAGKILVDCTNPVGKGLVHGLRSERSGSELIQSLAPRAQVVKAFTVYGFENFEDSRYPGYGDALPAMPIAGDSGDAKGKVSALCRELGWEPVDVGPLEAALNLEHMTLLWIRMARVQGLGPNFVWARLARAGVGVP